MCGRFAIGVDASTLVEVFELVHASDYTPGLDMAPSMTAPVILDSLKRGGWTAEPFRWGLVPGFANDRTFGRKTFNARIETAASKPAFRNAVSQRRCVVPVTAFYEWSHAASGNGKTRYRITADDAAVFGLAGLWERWRDRDGRPVHTFSILTRDAPESLQAIHQRAPIHVARDDIGRWLDPHWTSGHDALQWIANRDAGSWAATALESGEIAPRDRAR